MAVPEEGARSVGHFDDRRERASAPARERVIR